MTNYIEHLFICLLAICTSFLSYELFLQLPINLKFQNKQCKLLMITLPPKWLRVLIYSIKTFQISDHNNPHINRNAEKDELLSLDRY